MRRLNVIELTSSQGLTPFTLVAGAAAGKIRSSVGSIGPAGFQFALFDQSPPSGPTQVRVAASARLAQMQRRRHETNPIRAISASRMRTNGPIG